MTTDSNLGRLLANRYRLAELIGKGAMGRVYRAEDTLLGGVIAVKFLAQALLNPKMRDRFKSEARTCAQLGRKSIHIVNVIDYGVTDYKEEEVPFYVMEYLQGQSLSEVINNQPLPLPRFLTLARQISLGLQCAHQGIVIDDTVYSIIHRDIKPSNILVSRDASLGELVKILDFGISKLLQANSDQTSSYMGTLAYSSPEQMEGRELDSRSDIYSLGVMMYEMLTGKMPLHVETHAFGAWYKAHHSQPPRSFEAVSPHLKLPKALENLVMSCLAKSPRDRPQSVAHVLEALEPLHKRYLEKDRVVGDISRILQRKPVKSSLPPQLDLLLPVDGAWQVATWPQDKPTAQIVFAQTLAMGRQNLPAVWVMLPQQEIQNLQVYRLYNVIYKNFLYAMSPHPTLLWITGIYNRKRSQKGNGKQEQGPRWLPCYLDLKTLQGQELIRLLIEKGEYQLLLFGLEQPDACVHAMTITINESQRLQLQEWAITSQSWRSIGQATLSKNLLKSEFDKLKPRITTEMEKDPGGSSFGH
ncbi:serine/threonine protein kinase [Stenomitos frigidus]|uniref:non-specific serine/threonine protein kinase n=1 Tax=Stenomitos frigidus ULC18 TaxID=2107698 RepID=A0A2T1ENM9_9CYAN|nr:serine/threonine-protein kinase [Stenomitos frigidus]PSB34349.1 serine/threonine protein kinase [Stenomitos frigidus ULC18]